MALFTVSAHAQLPEYTSATKLLFEAIDAPDGTARGVLVGPIAEKFSETTGSNAPVVAEVTTIKRFQQEGCRRLALRLTQNDVPTKDGKRVPFTIEYGLNLCRDGNPPDEALQGVQTQQTDDAE
jgi:hypothetical protein